MKKEFTLFIILLIYTMLLINCSDDSGNSDSDMGTLSISITDAPAAYDSVVIIFSEISAHIDSDWVHVQSNPQRVNLMEWSNGRTLLLGSENVPAGKYTQIRLKIDSAFIGVNGKVHELEVPSGSKTGLKLGPQFTISEGSTYEMVLDFDASKSVVVLGNKKAPTGYKLKPHIRVITNALSGSVSGTVLNPEHLPVAHALNAGDTVTTTFVDTTDGFFRLSFLQDNLYTIFVEDTMGNSFTADSVAVNIGGDTDLGAIMLQ